MKIVAIQQPHYFPWMGYFHKLAGVDEFIFMDEVQLERRSQMIRNRILDTNGNIKYLTITGEIQNIYATRYCDFPTKDNAVWIADQVNKLRSYYRAAGHVDEMMEVLTPFFERDYGTVCQWTCESTKLICPLLGIDTPIVYKSALDYDREQKRSDLILELCKAVGADVYVAGRGASVQYLDRDVFAREGVEIRFQDFTHPVYPQCHSVDFVAGLSILDLFFNCGIAEAKRIFRETLP